MASYNARIFDSRKYPTAFQAADARIAIIAAQPSSFSELGGGEFIFAFEGVSGCEVSVNNRACRIGAARLLEPDDRFAGAPWSENTNCELRDRGG